jgi:hypothetical protein
MKIIMVVCLRLWGRKAFSFHLTLCEGFESRIICLHCTGSLSVFCKLSGIKIIFSVCRHHDRFGVLLTDYLTVYYFQVFLHSVGLL